MPCPRALPDPRGVVEDFRTTALWVNRVMYTVILGYAACSVYGMCRDGPQMTEKQLKDWGSMPWLTLCMDPSSSSSTFRQSVAIVAQGFGHETKGNAVSGQCSTDATSGLRGTDRWVEGVEVPGSAGRCQRLDLTRLYPFANGTLVNNLAIGGIVNYRRAGGGGEFPKFIAVATGLGSPESVLESPLVFLYPEVYRLDDEDRPQRIHSPSYDLEKQEVPQAPIPWLWDSATRELFTVRGMGLWKSCVPMHFKESISPGQIVFGFGLFVTQPTVKSVYSKGVYPAILNLVGGVGGYLASAFFLWRCIFKKQFPPWEKEGWDKELHTLHESLQGPHAAVHAAGLGVQRGVQGCFSSAEARELEEPLVA